MMILHGAAPVLPCLQLTRSCSLFFSLKKVQLPSTTTFPISNQITRASLLSAPKRLLCQCITLTKFIDKIN